jgi:RNA polymerase sigma-70 factor, ECF subfamily
MNIDQPAVEIRRAEFDALYAKHNREVWALAYSRRLDSEMALDIVQETFLRLWKHWESGIEEEIQNTRAWLLRVARNLAEDYAKSAFRRNGTQTPQLMNGVHAQDPPPLERMEMQELHSQVRALLEELPPADRDVLVLKYSLDYDTPDIAETLGIAVSAVHMRLSRARQRLAERLAARGITQGPS